MMTNLELCQSLCDTSECQKKKKSTALISMFLYTVVLWKVPTCGSMWFFFLPRLVSQWLGGRYSRPQYLQEICKCQVYLIAFLHLYVPHTICQLRVWLWIIGAAKGAFQCLQVTTTVWNGWKDTKTIGCFCDIWSLTCLLWVSHHPCLLRGSHWRFSSSLSIRHLSLGHLRA